MNSEMYVTGNDCYGSGARAISSLTLLLLVSLLDDVQSEGIQGLEIHIKASKMLEL